MMSVADLTKKNVEDAQSRAGRAVAAARMRAYGDDDKIAHGFRPLAEMLGGTDAEAEASAMALREMSTNWNDKTLITKAGGILPLVALLQKGTDLAKEAAAGALENLADAAAAAADRDEVSRAGAIPPLVALLENGTDKAKENAARALWNLAQNSDNVLSIAKAGAIRPLVALLEKKGTDDLAKEAAVRTLFKLASDNDSNKVSIAGAAAIPPLVALLQRGSDVAKMNAAGVLWLLAYNNKISFARAGAIPALVLLLQNGNELSKNGARTVLRALSYS